MTGLSLALNPSRLCPHSVHMMIRTITIAALFVLANLAIASEPATPRPELWAQPVKLDGVPNLHKVSDNLYRSAQPTAQGMKNLKRMGIETVVNLRSFHSDRDEIGNTGLGYEHIYMKAWHPERKEIVRFLQIVTNPKRRGMTTFGGHLWEMIRHRSMPGLTNVTCPGGHYDRTPSHRNIGMEL